MTYFITIEELKQTTFNTNLDNEYIAPALEEAQSIYLREIIGDSLYTAITNKIDDETLSGKYLTLVDQYIKPYLTYKVQSVIVIPLNNKTRNAGVINQYDQGFNTSTMKDTAYLAEHYDSRAEFYANRLTTYLQKNAADFPEYGYSDDNITQPTDTQNVTTIYLGGGRKRSCGLKTGSGGGSTDSVEWNDIQNKPDFAEVATSGSYNDLDDKPEIPTVNDATLTIKQGGTVKGTFSANSNQNVEIDLEAGGSGSTDWNDIQNKPDFATVATSGSYTDLSNRPDMDEYVDMETYNQDMGQVNNTLENKVSYGVYTPKMEAIDNALGDKVDTVALCTINNERIDTRGNFELVRTDSIATLTIKQGGTTKGTFTPNSGTDVEIDLDAGGSGSTDWNDITNKPNFATVATSGDYEDLANKPTIPAPQVQADWQQNDSTQPDYIKNRPSMPSAQVQSDWNQTNTSEVDYIKNKPTIPVVPTNVSAFANDAGYLTQHQSLAGYATENWVQQQGYSTFSGSYNDLSDKPTIPAAQVNSDWNAVSGVAQILNKPTIPTVNDSTINIYQGSTLKGSFSLNQSSGQNINLDAGGSGSQVQSDWNQVDNSQVDFIKNKPTVYTEWFGTKAAYDLISPKDPNTIYHIEGAAPEQSDWNEADNTSMAYIKNKPTIPAAQVQSDWNQSDTTAVDYIKNKPSIPVVPNHTTETWEFTLQDNTTVTKTVYLVPSV